MAGDPTYTPGNTANIGDNVGLYFCITDPDLDASHVTVSQYLLPDTINPYFPPETAVIQPQTSQSICYAHEPIAILGPAGQWNVKLVAKDAKGNRSAPVFTTPKLLTIN